MGYEFGLSSVTSTFSSVISSYSFPLYLLQHLLMDLLYDPSPQAMNGLQLPLWKGRAELDDALLEESQWDGHQHLETLTDTGHHHILVIHSC